MERAVRHSIPKPIAVIVSYPANPTAYVADLDFYRDLVVFAKANDLFILSDLAYSEIYFNGVPTPSVLQVNGRRSTSPSSSPPCPRPSPWPAGAWASRSAMSACARRLRG